MYSYFFIYNVKKSIKLGGNFDDLAIRVIHFNAHRPMEHILGFVQSNYMLPSGECPPGAWQPQ